MKKVLSLVLVMLMTLTVMLVVVPPIEVEAAVQKGLNTNVNSVSGSEFTKFDDLAKKLDSILAGKVGLYSDISLTKSVTTKLGTKSVPPGTTLYWKCSTTICSGQSCFAYAISAYCTLYDGTHPQLTLNSKHERITAGNGSTISYNNFVNWGVRNDLPVYIRIGSDGGGDGHSILVLTYDKDYITYLDGNGDGNGLIAIRKEPWVNKFDSYTGSNIYARKISYIVQPKDSYYPNEGQSQTFEPATIAEGEYYLKNGDYRVYMVKDDKGADTIAASSTDYDGNELFGFSVVKDGSYYKITPILTNNDYVLNCYWGQGGIQTLSGNEITLWINDGDRSERWIFEEYGAGYLIHPADRTDLAITREGSKLYVRETTKAQNQIWEFESFCSHIYKKNFNSTQHWNECSKCGDKRTFGSHTYTNNCDTGCNICNYTRTAPHTYSYSCDPSCNDCYSQREVTHTYNSTYSYDYVDHWKNCTVCGDYGTFEKHVYTNSCDASCNICNYQRAVTHTYDNDCDTTCNVCGNTRTVSHSYGSSYKGDFDDHWKVCDLCGEKSTLETHVWTSPEPHSDDRHKSICVICHITLTSQCKYTDDCDTTCNECGNERIAAHVYDDEQDATCNLCGAVREIETLPITTPEPNPESTPESTPEPTPDEDSNNATETKPVDENQSSSVNNEEKSEGLETSVIIVIVIASAVTLVSISVLATTIVLKKKF